MTFRRHHPRLSRLLSYYVGSERQAQAMLSLYCLRGSWPYEDWIAYRSMMAAILLAVIPARHAVQRHSSASGATISHCGTPTTSPVRSSLTGALRSPGGS